MKKIAGIMLATVLAGAALQGCVPIIATGVGVGALAALDRRSSGAYVEDESLEWKVRQSITDYFGKRVHVSVTSYNRTVLLTGETPDASLRDHIQKLAAAVPNVRAITNDVQVAGISSYTSRSNDTLITSKVKGRLLESNNINANYVKVVTEASTVYLMGLVTHSEANIATDIARNTDGVQRVVRVFEYIAPNEAARIDNEIRKAPSPPTQQTIR